MSDKPNNPFQFWQELKRRKVILVIPVYAAASFVLLELVDIIVNSLRLLEWTLTFILILLYTPKPLRKIKTKDLTDYYSTQSFISELILCYSF